MLVNAEGLEPSRIRLRTVALGRFAFAFMLVDRVGIGPTACCLQGITAPQCAARNTELVTPTTRPVRTHWPRLPATSRFGTSGRQRSDTLSGKGRVLCQLSYGGMWCSVLESNQAGPQRTPGLQPGRGPSPSNATFGAQCRLSACDLRFVGPLLFTSELTGHIGDLQGYRHPLTR